MRISRLQAAARLGERERGDALLAQGGAAALSELASMRPLVRLPAASRAS